MARERCGNDRRGVVKGQPASAAAVLRVLVESGIVGPARPDRSVAQLLALRRWGATPAGGYEAAAARSPHALAAVDERREVTFAELHERTVRLANALGELGVGPGDTVALYCRNHVGLLESVIAVSRLGADAVLVNTGLSTPLLHEVMTVHRPAVVITDDEFLPRLDGAPGDPTIVTAWHEGPNEHPAATLDSLIACASPVARRAPGRPGRVIVLTSGTTGTPRGARRPTPPGLGSAASVLSRIPLRAGDRVMVSAPLFHTWGFAALLLAMPLRACLVLHRRFDPEDVLATIERHRVTASFAVPVMLQRIMELPETTRHRYDTTSLRVVAVSGSSMPPTVVTGVLDAFGPVLYNLYGSTEVSWASIATPEELRATPATAGRPPLGTRVVVLDDTDQPVPQGETGRVFVANDMLFDGYTEGGSKPTWGSFMATGDLGYVDASGLLFVCGRDDDMIVSGGENAYPRAVEDALAELPGVREVAVFGVPDEEYGQRFAAYLALRQGSTLTADDVRTYATEHLARFLVPRDIEFVPELPRNATGKVLVRELRLRHAAGTRREDPGRATERPLA